MKISIVLYVILGLLPVLQAESGRAQVLEKRVTANYMQVSLHEVILDLQTKTSVDFGFTKELNLDNIKVNKVVFDNKTLENVLHALLDQHNVSFSEAAGTILLTPRQQPGSVTGRVTDASGNALSGATVRLRPAGRPIATDVNGNYHLSTQPGAYTLEVSYISYETKRHHITIEDGKTITLNIVLREDQGLMDEVVVTGQGMDISKRRLSTAITSIKGQELEKFTATRIDQLLQSKLPNAQIKLTGGQAGATSIIRGRGVVSAFMNATPVIYIDGVRMDNLNTASTIGGGGSQAAGVSSIADIPLENIERIEFINGGAATTIYGSDAANGVIQIFTKKGGSDRTSVSFEATVGTESATTDFNYFKRTKELLYQPGSFQKYNVAINGASGDFGYSFTGGFTDSDGVQILNQNRNRRVDMRSGFRARLGHEVTYESSFSYVNNAYARNRNGNQGGYTGLWFVESGASAVTGPQPRFNPRIDDLDEAEFARMKEYVRRAEELQDNEIVVNRFQTSQSFQYRPFNQLQIKALGGVDYRTLRNQNISTNEYLTHTTGNLSTDRGSISSGERKFLGITLEANAQHKAEIKNFSFVSTLGGQLFRNEDRQISYNGTNLRDGARNISDAATRTSNEVYYEVVNYGVYVQTNIGYQNKLFLDLGLRGDGNSAFGKNIGVQYYPKVGLSYIPSAERWFSSGLSWINSAKVRGSFGVAGNFPTPFRNLRTVSFPGYLGGQAADFGAPGVDLRPEKTSTYEGGVDLGILKDRITLSVGYYHSITNDALFNVPAAPSTAEENAFRNIGEILNQGWELSTVLMPLRTDVQSVKINFSLNTLHNKVLSSGGAAPFNLNGFSERTIQTVVQEGYPIGYIRGSYGEFGPDGVMSKTTPLQFLGSTLPDLFGSFGLAYQYKQFQLYANADYQEGAYSHNWDSQFRYNYGAGDEGIPQGEINSPRKRTGWLDFSNMFVEKADYIKVRTIGASYSWTKGQLGRYVQHLTLGFNVYNPFNFATSTFDPEATISGSAAGQGGASTGGISYATYSAPRQYLLTLKTTF